jgi:hypothetical protein
MGARRYDKYKFSVNRDIFNVSPYAFINPDTLKDFMNIIVEKIGYSDFVPTKLRELMGLPSYMFYMPKQPGNLFMRLNTEDEYGRLRHTRKELPQEYKIHLCVKEEYQLYAFIKLALIFIDEFLKWNPNDYLELKWNTLSRFSHLLPDDIVLRTINGGPAASIVLYTRTADPDVMHKYLQTIMQAFPEHEVIGSMDLENDISIPYGNVRLNRLLCYAQGDRQEKIANKKANRAAAVRPKKAIPEWIKELTDAQSRLYLGLPAPGALNDTCVEDICYLAIDKTMLDPRTVIAGGRRKRTLKNHRRRKN